jgi:hypothetical protein
MAYTNGYFLKRRNKDLWVWEEGSETTNLKPGEEIC